jgi:Ran GTPase-activating protein (RanGAP) involved in mRNA processing and transport
MKNGQSQFLSLNNRGLTNLPEQIENKDTLRKVENLELRNNHIYKLPKSLIWCKKLRILDLSNNCISKISKCLKEARNLRYLNLTRNYIKEFTDADVSCIRYLNTLILSKNEIVSISPKISFIDNLKVLYLDGNPF